MCVEVYTHTVGQKFDKCAKRTECIADCVAGDESKRVECVKDVCPKEMCVEEMTVGQTIDTCAQRADCVAACVAGDESKRFQCVKDVCPKDMCVEVYTHTVGQKFDKCAKRTECIADCVAGDESKRIECVKDVCPKEMCVEELEVGDDYWSEPTRDCFNHSFNAECTGCRDPYDSCCHNKNCRSGRKCKAGMWSYSCV